MKITGNNHWIDIDYAIPDWAETKTEELCFTYKKHLFFLSEFTVCGFKNLDGYKKSDYFSDYDGYMNDTYFSGILIKLSPDCEQVKAFTFYI